jgi:hypothetical protein
MDGNDLSKVKGEIDEVDEGDEGEPISERLIRASRRLWLLDCE